MGAGTDSLAAAIEVIATFVSDFEPGRYSGDDAATLVSWFCRAERLSGAGKTLAATRVAESRRPEQAGHKTAADWLASVTRQPVGQAVDELKLGEALAHQPGLDAAYRGGRLSRPGAALVADAAAVNPSRGEELVQQAEHDSWRQLRDRCLRVRAEGQSAEEAARRAAAIHKARRCRTWTDVDGSFRLDATLTAEAGAALSASLSKESARFFDRARKDGVFEPRDAYTADALVALVTGRGIIGNGAGRGQPGDNGSSGRSKRSPKGRAPDPKAIVHLRVDLDALRRGEIGAGEVCEIPGVGPVPIETARNLLGDALVDLVIANGVDVTTICHLGRSIPTALRTALVERDRTCVVPGCESPKASKSTIGVSPSPTVDRRPGKFGSLVSSSPLSAYPSRVPAQRRPGAMGMGGAPVTPGGPQTDQEEGGDDSQCQGRHRGRGDPGLRKATSSCDERRPRPTCPTTPSPK